MADTHNARFSLHDRIATITMTGAASCERITAAIDEHYPSLRGVSILWDFTGSDVSQLVTGDFEAIAARAGALLDRTSTRKTAYVVSGNEAYLKACKYLNIAVEARLPAEYAVFTSLAEARNWLARE